VRTNQAFEVLGIPPTEDGRAVRAAFRRLAKIYHPDRFVEMPSDVRDEAERRMKEATTAYELIRSRKTEGPAHGCASPFCSHAPGGLMPPISLLS